MLLGTHTPKLDDKGRVILPSKFRDDLGAGIVPRPLVGVTARITPPSMTTKPITPTTTKVVETPKISPPRPTRTRIVP